MKPKTGLVIFSLKKRAASSSAEPPISPIMTTASVASSSWNLARMSEKLEPAMGSPPMPTTVDWPMPLDVSSDTR